MRAFRTSAVRSTTLTLCLVALGACGGAQTTGSGGSTGAARPSGAHAQATGPRLTPAATPLEVGATTPAFSINGSTGTALESRAATGAGPLVLVFYRGGFCSDCLSQLTQIQARLPEFQRRHATIWAISTDSVEDAQRVVTEQHLEFPVASDHDMNVIRGFGLVMAGQPMALPATYIVTGDGQSLRVIYRYVGETSNDRPSPSALIEALNEAGVGG